MSYRTPWPGQRLLTATLAALAALGVAARTLAPASADEVDSALPALYTTAQADRGKMLYIARCARCHGRELVEGSAPPLSGPQFFTRRMNNRLGTVFAYLAREMPQDRPGSLTHEQYADVMAYVLWRNGYPAGNDALTYDRALTSDAVLYFAQP